MPPPESQAIAQHLIDLQKRIDAMQSHFYHLESEFSREFQSLEERSSYDRIAEVNILRQLLSRYIERRTELALDELLSQSKQLKVEASDFESLSSWLAEMARHEDDELDDCFATWQRTSKAFLSYIKSESDFVNSALSTLNASLGGEPSENNLLQ